MNNKKFDFKPEIVKKLQEHFAWNYPDEEIPSIETIIINIRVLELIDKNIEYFKTKEYIMLDVSCDFVNGVKEIFKEIEEFKKNERTMNGMTK